MSVHFTSQRQNWRTPRKFYCELNKEFNFNFDPCPTEQKTFEEHGLFKEWGSRTFCNPPYSDIGRWVSKGLIESKKGKLVVMLIPRRTDTKCWHNYCMMASEIRFIKGRLHFDDHKN